MTQVSEAATERAREVLGIRDSIWDEAAERNVAHFIQQVSDAAKGAVANAAKYPGVAEDHLAPFILPEPVDPLAEVLKHYERANIYDASKAADYIRAELAKRGLKIEKIA